METASLRLRLISLLRSWEAGEIDETQVRDTAEELERGWGGWQVLDAAPAHSEPSRWTVRTQIASHGGSTWTTRRAARLPGHAVTRVGRGRTSSRTY
jgi:hypothetical protein